MKKRGVIDVLVENVGKEQFGARPNAGEPGFESIETKKTIVTRLISIRHSYSHSGLTFYSVLEFLNRVFHEIYRAIREFRRELRAAHSLAKFER
jgi:hypothetical protein